MFEAEWKNRKAKRAGRPEVVPLYDMNDAVGVLGHFVSCDYHSVINVCEGLKVRFVDAGHLLGSSSIEMWISENTAEGVEERKIVFSGDIGPGTARSSRIRSILHRRITWSWSRRTVTARMRHRRIMPWSLPA